MYVKNTFQWFKRHMETQSIARRLFLLLMVLVMLCLVDFKMLKYPLNGRISSSALVFDRKHLIFENGVSIMTQDLLQVPPLLEDYNSMYDENHYPGYGAKYIPEINIKPDPGRIINWLMPFSPVVYILDEKRNEPVITQYFQGSVRPFMGIERNEGDPPEVPAVCCESEPSSTASESQQFENCLGANLDVNNVDEGEFRDFIFNNYLDDLESLGAASLPISDAPSRSSISLEEHTTNHSLLSDLFDFNQLGAVGGIPAFMEEEMDVDEMRLTMAEEEAFLDFYKNFNDVAASEALRAMPIEAAEGRRRLSLENEVPGVGEVPEGDGRAQTVDSQLITLDDWWETDSGVFDFLESPHSQATSGGDVEISDIPDSPHSDPIEFDGESSREADMIQAASIHPNGRPTSHPAQPRGFQVHARMPGLFRGGSSDQRLQEIASLFNFQQGGHDGSALGPSLAYPFGAHHHIHHHGGPPLHHHHHHYPPPAAPYNSDTARSVLLQNATLPASEVGSPYSSVNMGPPHTISSAVASSMHLTNSSDPMVDPSTHYKMIEPSHDMIYYPNATNNAAASSEMNNQSTEGLFSSILLNDDDFMDMAISEGIYSMRMMDNGATNSNSIGSASASQANLPNGSMGANAMQEDRLEASSDSAVSSMGSERVPPMTDPSDSEWVEPDSHPHSSHDSSPYSLEYSSGKSRSSYDYYGKDRGAPVAQKKHHMFGKRFQQEQNGSEYMLPPHHPSLPLPYPSAGGIHPSSGMDPLGMKYGCGVEFVRHQNDLRSNGGLGSLDSIHNNHTYALPPTHSDSSLLSLNTFKTPKPPSKEKSKKESISRDEKKARTLNLPINTDDIINLPMDEFNERLSKYDLSEPQLTLIRDIRRRGKNKVAAQNCRKRKLDQILQLADEVQRIRERKQSLLREQQDLAVQRNDIKERYSLLYSHIMQGLRDSDGNPLNCYDYSLQQTADGNIIIVPKNVSHPSSSGENIPPSSRRDKSKDEYNKKGAQ